MDFAIKNTNWTVFSLVLFTQLANAENVTYLYIKEREFWSFAPFRNQTTYTHISIKLFL